MVNLAGTYEQCSLDIKVAVSKISSWALGKAKTKVDELVVTVSDWARCKVKSKVVDFHDVLRMLIEGVYFFSGFKQTKLTTCEE